MMRNTIYMGKVESPDFGVSTKGNFAFVDELALLQPTPGYMRLVKDRILHVWEQRRAEANDRTVEQQRRVSAIQQKVDKLDEALAPSEGADEQVVSRTGIDPAIWRRPVSGYS